MEMQIAQDPYVLAYITEEELDKILEEQDKMTDNLFFIYKVGQSDLLKIGEFPKTKPAQNVLRLNPYVKCAFFYRMTRNNPEVRANGLIERPVYKVYFNEEREINGYRLLNDEAKEDFDVYLSAVVSHGYNVDPKYSEFYNISSFLSEGIDPITKIITKENLKTRMF